MIAEAAWWNFCPENERWMYCKTGCERKCGDDLSEKCIHSIDCLEKNLCECQLGFVRLENRCVRPDECPE
ncbi:unnamed protein product, partial [Mesorhabditis belari]|uniref:TIL domain-containing protein n=1 Tax=Mesorhabditis belari TaxID=2138241 RepID=A0AAF3F4L3_9BILA